MRRVGMAVLVGGCAYVLAALCGYGLVQGLSANSHDRSLEAVMTGGFVTGPLGAIAGFVLGLVRGGRAGHRT